MEYSIYLNTTTKAINAEFDKYTADKLDIRFFKEEKKNLFLTKIRTGEKAKFKNFGIYTLDEAIRIDKRSRK